MRFLSKLLQGEARGLRRRSGLLVPAVVILALGFGVGLFVVSVARALLWSPLPVPEPGELVGLFSRDARGRNGLLSLPDLRDLRRGSETLQGLAGFISVDLALDDGDGVSRISAQVVTADYFEVLGLAGLRGPGLSPDDPPGERRIVLSDGFRRRRYGGDSALLGRTVRVNGEPFEVVGVTPPGFTGTVPSAPVDAWVPLDLHRIAIPRLDPGLVENRSTQWLIGVGRRKPAASFERASRELESLYANREHDGREEEDWRLAVVPGSFGTSSPRSHAASVRLLRLATAGTALLLIVVCANVSMLLLVRVAGRRDEMSIRQTLGAGRAALAGLALVDAVVLALGGALLGMLIAATALRTLPYWAPGGSVLQGIAPRLGLPEAAFAAGLVLVLSLLSAVAPALTLVRSPASGVPEGLRSREGGGRRRTFTHRAFCVAQLALAVLLLSGGALVLTSYGRLAGTDLGFSTEGLVVATVDPALSGMAEESWPHAYRRVRERLESAPAVESASLAFTAPLGRWRYGTSLIVPGRDLGEDGATDTVSGNLVTPGYFESLGLELIAGRDFTDRDAVGKPDVAVVSRALAAELWPSGRAVGRRFELWSPGGDHRAVEVVGVVADSRQGRQVTDAGGHLYLPLAQHPMSLATVLVRSRESFGRSVRAVEGAVREAAPELLLFDVHRFEDRIGRSLEAPRTATGLLVGLGGLSLALSLVGLHGLLSYLWSQRRREIGVRMALGARRGDVLALAARQGMALTAVGILLGSVPSPWLERWLASWLEAPSAPLPVLTATVAAVVATVSLVSMLLPAWRASRTDPQASLRQE